MGHIATVELVLDTVNEIAAADAVNELLRAQQSEHLPDSELLDYRIDAIAPVALDPEQYSEGDAFRRLEAGQSAAEADPSEAAMNRRRAGWALQALKAFARATGLDLRIDFDTALGDLLANLRHLCDERGLDFPAFDQRAHEYYVAERADAKAEAG